MTVRVTTLKGTDAGSYYVDALPNYYLDADEYCPPNSKHPNMLVPRLGQGRWEHITDRHLHQWANDIQNNGNPDQFFEADEVDDYPFHANLTDEENTKRLVMLLIYAAICFGEAEVNTGPTAGSLYTAEFPTEIGLKPLDGVETRKVQVLVRDGDFLVHTAFPLNPANQ